MKISLWNKRFIYMAGHQVFTVVLAICVFAYDYLLRIPGQQNEIAYMIKNNKQTSFHFAVDDKDVVQGIPENRNAWHCGDGNGKGNEKLYL